VFPLRLVCGNSTISGFTMATPKGATDARHTVLCAAGFNLRWLLRAIARYGLKAFFDRDR